MQTSPHLVLCVDVRRPHPGALVFAFHGGAGPGPVLIAVSPARAAGGPAAQLAEWVADRYLDRCPAERGRVGRLSVRDAVRWALA